MNKPRTVLYASFGLVLVLALFAFLFSFPPEKPVKLEHSTAQIDHAISLFNREKYDEVLQQLEEIPVSSVNDWRIPYYKGSAQIMLGDYQDAVNSLEQALTMNNQGTGILYALGVAYYKQGNIKLAKAYFASVLEINPADVQANGMVDIMAKLERQLSKEATTVTDPEENDD